MAITGVYFIPSNPNASTALATVTERLHTALAEEPTLVGRWFLEHKLMRDTPSCLPASTPQQRQAQPRYMQFLSLSYHANHGFIYTSEPAATTTPTNPPPAPAAAPTAGASSGSPSSSSSAGPMVMTTVPLASSSTLFHHFGYACQPFWCHRHTVTVPGGAVYDVGDFRVRVGDVRQTQPAARIRGTVVEIEWRGPSLVSSIAAQALLAKKMGPGAYAATGAEGDGDSAIDVSFFPDGVEEADVEAEYAASAALIREFWARLGIEGAREAILVPDVGREVKEQLKRLKAQQGMQRESEEKREQQPDEDPDPTAGVDSARQFMEIFRFNR
ncbi:hypothetical protein BO86DRAFT_354337 [Aspergillus japonicus CBS 114.51]|uniref:Mediator of RNA polymerase II transcription subunit 20 n=2 Tax=Aspergillus TaxID=5052 RepID=A0A2V5I6X5_ASPV1|nr:hypothetical protein BO86DRAFT_354337 [Aspergillus japonicus CBS 114.51]PYI15376.1 hypothetical protein BO99DRAFT_392683 [Aspergillus violaceofuscus CBS 115571]RAH85634.1 hypothetical protein BO86DRAFT_354337 [Aspergillus japonicus CBS 114.51]